MKKWGFLLFLLLGLDFFSKAAALTWIPFYAGGTYPFGGLELFALGPITCSFNTIFNTGVAWGFFAGHAGLLFAVRCALIAGIAYFMPKRFPVWLILMGAVGNAIDYCLYGHVVDFIHFTFWGYSFPIFNVADSCITLGVLSLVVFPRKAKEAELV